MKLSNMGKKMGCLLRKKGSTRQKKHTAKLLCLVLSLALAGFTILADSGIGTVNANDYGIIIINGTDNETGDMTGLVSDVTIENQKGETVMDGKLFVGEKYTIHLKFTEGGMDGGQFRWTADGKMTYQIPKSFRVEPRSNVDLVIDGVVIGKYSVDENGRLTIELTEEGKTKLDNSNNYTLSFDMDATAQKTEGGNDEDVHFGDAGDDFHFVVTDQPQISVEKLSDYHSDTKILDYTVHTTVDHGPIHDVVVSDTLTPPETPGITLEMVSAGGKPEIKVTVMRNGTPVELTEKDYELVPVAPDPTNPYAPQIFQVKLKEESEYNPLQTGDELFVNYQYQAKFEQSAADRFFGQVVNEATVSGSMPMKDPQASGETEVPVEEKRGSYAEVYWDTNGDGVVSKAQHYSEATGKLHYTLYALAKAGEYTPFYIQDQATVQYDGYTWIVQGFDAAHCQNLEVYAQDIGNWDNLVDEKGHLKPEAIMGERKELTGYEYQAYLNAYYHPEGYSATSMDNYISMMLDNAIAMNIFFGMDAEHAQGHWNYTQDRLITVEYDLDVSNGLTLYREENGKVETVTLSKEDVLLAGITNKVTLQYGPFFPSYTVFFSNGEKLNKYGRLDKVNNTIDYTVSLNLQDSTVWEYLMDVGNQSALIASAAFYDDYADGWDYDAEKGLKATVYLINGTAVVYTYSPGAGDYFTRGSITEDDFSDGDIKAYLWNFKNDGGLLLPYFFTNDWTTLVDRLEFTYTLKASDAWLQEHAYGEDDTNVHNAAQILDDAMTHWNAEANVPYFPNRLNKTAKQDGTSNLITFTLDINSVGADLDPAKDYLIVTDDSTGIQINPSPGNIKVTRKDGTPLTCIGDTTIDAPLEPGQWGFLPTEVEHQYKLKIPDGVALQITYGALVTEMGDSVEVSNKASIDGVTRSDSSYEGSLKVDEIHASGGGDEYQLTIVKVDRDNISKKLPNAKFKLYAVKKPESGTPSGEQYKEKITIGETTYQCQLKQELITDADGSVPVDSKNLEPGRYYILEEINPPEGYVMLEEPLLFYFGLKQEGIDPTVAIAPPDGMLTVSDPPVQYTLPETGGIGTSIFLAAGLAFLFAGGVALTIKKCRIM